MVDAYKSLFSVDDFLGEGGFGKVYKVVSKKDRKRYALKVIQLDNYDVTLSDVRTEFNLMTKLDHPNIIEIYNSFQVENRNGGVTSYAIQMEYCPNGDLTTVLENRNGTLFRRRKLVQWMEDLASAVEYFHEKNIIHRDLKPDNILLDRRQNLRISDFGIGKIMTQYYAMTGAGTPGFIAPEVFSGRYSKKADIYSLGKVFICMATVDPNPGKAADIPDRYRPDIFEIIEDCVERTPKNRPTASELLQEIYDLDD